MKRRWLALALVGCGDSTAVVAQESGGETTFASSSTGTAPANDTSTTTGLAPVECAARRYSLLDDELCHHAAIGDLDADGHADLFVMPGPEHNFIASEYLHRLHTFRGGAGELQAPELHCCLEVGSPAALELMDVNGDGRMDPLYVVDHHGFVGDVGYTRGSLDLLVRGPLGGYLPERIAAQGTIRFHQPRYAIGAFAQAGPSVVVSDGDSELRMLVADGLSLVPTPDTPLPLSSYVRALAVTDLDGDGLDDVVALHEDRVALIRSTAGGPLVLLGEITPPIMGSALLVGDLDAIGGNDIVLVGEGGTAVGLVSPDAIDWHTQPELAITSPSVLVDLDMDAVADLVTVDGAMLVVYRGGSGGTFASQPSTIAQGVGDAVRTIVAGDLDGDARADVAVCDGLGVLVVSVGSAQ